MLLLPILSRLTSLIRASARACVRAVLPIFLFPLIGGITENMEETATQGTNSVKSNVCKVFRIFIIDELERCFVFIIILPSAERISEVTVSHPLVKEVGLAVLMFEDSHVHSLVNELSHCGMKGDPLLLKFRL